MIIIAWIDRYQHQCWIVSILVGYTFPHSLRFISSWPPRRAPTNLKLGTGRFTPSHKARTMPESPQWATHTGLSIDSIPPWAKLSMGYRWDFLYTNESSNGRCSPPGPHPLSRPQWSDSPPLAPPVAACLVWRLAMVKNDKGKARLKSVIARRMLEKANAARVKHGNGWHLTLVLVDSFADKGHGWKGSVVFDSCSAWLIRSA